MYLLKFYNFILGNIFEFLSVVKINKAHKKTIIFSSISNVHFNQNSKEIFEYFLSYHPNKYNLYFVVNDNNILEKLKKEYGNYFINSNSIKGIKISADADAWVCSDLAQPYYRLFNFNKRVVYHLGHGIPLKKIVLNVEKISLPKKIHRLILSRSFTHILAYSDFFIPYMKDIFRNQKAKYITLGQPRYDSLLKKSKNKLLSEFKQQFPEISISSKLVLYAPTWRFYSNTRLFPFDNLEPKELQNFLAKNNIFIFLRRHPFRPQVDNEQFLKCDNVLDFDSSIFPDASNYLTVFNALITDYSSIYFDYITINRPVAFFPYDLETYKKEVGFTIDYDMATPGPKCLDKTSFFYFLQKLDSQDYSKERINIANKFNIKNTGNCKENADFLMELLDK